MTQMPPPLLKYPSAPHQWRHGPEGYLTIESFRQWLRDEFDFRCVYCMSRETWCVTSSMTIDHFVPVVHAPHLHNDYSNLRYACSRCNSSKSIQHIECPLQTFLAEAVSIQNDGVLVGKTAAASCLIEQLALNDPDRVSTRRLLIEIIMMAAKCDPVLHGRLMGYPERLPDLSKLNPPRNSRPQGIEQSAFARRQRGELPATY